MKIAGLTDKGLHRSNNEDSFGYTYKEDGSLLAILCDGIGGSNAGDVASKIAVETFLEDFKKSGDLLTPQIARDWIKNEVDYCNDKIYQIACTNKNYFGMGTTLVGVLITNGMTLILNIGDSRVYGMFEEMVCLTQDHNLLQELVHSGQLTEEEVNLSTQRNVLTNALGVYDKAKVDIGLVNENYDCLLLCSDGLHGYVTEYIIQDILLKNKSIEEKNQLFIQAALIEGGYDNVTVVLIEKEVE